MTVPVAESKVTSWPEPSTVAHWLVPDCPVLVQLTEVSALWPPVAISDVGPNHVNESACAPAAVSRTTNSSAHAPMVAHLTCVPSRWTVNSSPLSCALSDASLSDTALPDAALPIPPPCSGPPFRVGRRRQWHKPRALPSP